MVCVTKDDDLNQMACIFLYALYHKGAFIDITLGLFDPEIVAMKRITYTRKREEIILHSRIKQVEGCIHPAAEVLKFLMQAETNE